METAFVRIDVDQDGVITVKDFEVLADKLTQSRQLDMERGNQLKSTLVEVCLCFTKHSLKIL